MGAGTEDFLSKLGYVRMIQKEKMTEMCTVWTNTPQNTDGTHKRSVTVD